MKKSKEEAEKVEEQKKQGHWGMSKHAITRHEKREARKKAAATNSAESEASIIADTDGAVADESIDNNGALDVMAIVAPDHATKGAEKEAQVKQKKKLDEAKKMRALKDAQLREHKRRTDRPHRRVTSIALLESI